MLTPWTDQYPAQRADSDRADAVAQFILERLRQAFRRKPTERELKAFDRVVVGINERSAAALSSVVGVNPAQIESIGLALLAEFRKRNVALITSVREEHLAAVERALANANIGTLSAKDLAARLQETLEVSQSKAEFWAIDQTLKLNADINEERQTTLGIESYVWSTSQDARVRSFASGDAEDHTLLEGQTFQWSDPPEMPGLPGERAHPGQRYRCRCVAIPVL